MTGLNAQAYAQLTTLLEENGLSSILGGISNWTSANPRKCITDERRMPKKETSGKSKKKLLKLLNEKHPDWELGKGKGINISALKNALETGEKPEPKKRENPYFDFLAVVRKEVASLGLSPKQIISLGSNRWAVLKLFAATKGYTTKQIIKNPNLLKQVAANYAPIEESLKGMEKTKKVKEPKKANTTEKVDTHKNNMDDQPVAGMFCMSDEESDDEDEE
jgi:hypothetical protein